MTRDEQLAELIAEQAADRSDYAGSWELGAPIVRFSDLETTNDHGEPVSFNPPDPSVNVLISVLANELMERYLSGSKQRSLPFDGYLLKTLGVGLPDWRPDVESALSTKRYCPVCGKGGPRRAWVCLACLRSPAYVEAQLQRKAKRLRFTRDSDDPITPPRGEAEAKAVQDPTTAPSLAERRFAGKVKPKKRTAATADLVRVVKPGSNRSMQIRTGSVATYIAAGWALSPSV